MQFPETFVPTAGQVGLLSMVTEFFLLVAIFSFLGAFVFFLATKNSVAPRHRSGAAIAAVITGVAGLSYWFIQIYYHDMLHQLAATADAAGRRRLVHDAYLAIGQYRYMEWAVTTPLLLLKMALVLPVKPREIALPLAAMLFASFWMVLAGYIGEQQLVAQDGSLLVGRHCLWGGVAALGYLVIPCTLFWRLGRGLGGCSQGEAAQAYRWMALTTVTTWGVYPIGYLVTALLPAANLNWVHIAYTLADLFNKLSVCIIAYLAGAAELERQVPPEAIQPARIAT